MRHNEIFKTGCEHIQKLGYSFSNAIEKLQKYPSTSNYAWAREIWAEIANEGEALRGDGSDDPEDMDEDYDQTDYR